MSDVGGSQIVVETFRIILDFNFLLSSTFIFSFNELFLQLVGWEGLHKRIEFFLLVVSSRSPRIHKNLRADHSCQNLRFLGLILLNVDNNEEVKVLTLIIVGSGGELHCTEVNLSINHFHFTFAPDANI